MARIPWRIFISRSIRRSSLLLNKPMATSWWAMPTLHIFFGRFAPRGFVGFFVSLILLHHAAVHVVPDIHDLRPRLFQSGSSQCIAVGLFAQFQYLIEPLAVHFLRYRIILDPLADPRHIFFSDIQPPQRPAFFAIFLHHAQAADGHQLLASQVELASDHQLLLGLHLKLKRERFAQL